MREAYGQRAVAVVTLGLTAFYAAHVYYFLVRRIADRELMLSFMGLAVFFLAVTIPLVLSREWITVSWAIQALVMLWLADKLKSAVPPPGRVSALRARSGSVRIHRSACPVFARRCRRRRASRSAITCCTCSSGWWSSACRSPRWRGLISCSSRRVRRAGWRSTRPTT